MVQRWMYARSDSRVPCLQARSSSSEAGRLYVDLKFSMKDVQNLLQELMDPCCILFSQWRADPVSMSWMYCMAVTWEPP